MAGHHAEPCPALRNARAAQGGERGRHGGRRERDKERHLRL